MINKIIFILLILSGGILNAQDSIDIIGKQMINKDNLFNGRFPLYTENGTWKYSKQPNWFSGFTSGELWNLYDMTGNPEYKQRALVHADSLLKYSSLDNTHDMGFIFLHSCVKAYNHTGDKKYRDAALQAARMVALRFNKEGNFIRAWGKLGTDDRAGLLIIDTMMNLELLFWAAVESGDYNFYDIAYKHAITCMKENVRSNYSSYHVIEFDPKTGKIIRKKTNQGFADESTWARGQAWGVYGFALAYKYTGDIRFLKTSRKMADYFLAHLPDDLIPYWDLDLKGEGVIRDASAGAIAASGMFLLADLSDGEGDYKKYSGKASEITSSLHNNYLFTKSGRAKEEGLLLHTVYNFSKGWGVNESFPCGDFYFVECLKKEYDKKKQENFISDNAQRESLIINDTWFYLEENIALKEDLKNAVTEWKKINLPHTWNTTDALDAEPGYRRGLGWYKKELFIPELHGRRVMLDFEGVNNKCEVYVNGVKAGEHIGGYVGFKIEITPYITINAKNTILVKADNSYDPYLIPSQKSDFILYGGITRNVRLLLVPDLHIDKFLVATPEVSAKSAKATGNIYLSSSSACTVETEAVIKDKDNKIVSKKRLSINLTPGMNEKQFEMPAVKNPKLWSPADPELYSIELTLLNGGKIIDRITDRIGFRWFEFKEKGAFYINGKRLLLRGTHRHEELSGYGNALPDSIHRNDIKMIKKMGANFVRLAHYPQAREVYKACDELGLLVWDENPWCRGGMGPQLWKENTKRIFKEIINQNYNHPSIILWSIGNESDWLPDFNGGDNPDSLKAFASELNSMAKTLDPYRLTVTRKFPAAQTIVDVFSPSIWSGWYSDVYKNYEKSLIKARDANKRMFHAEFGGDSHIGRHTENPIDGGGKITTTGGDEPINKIQSGSIANTGDWSESYIVDLFDWYLHVTEKLDWLTGSAQWIFRDFTTPLRPENPIPYVNQKGLVDMNNNPKDAYYVFKSYWNSDDKFCYIESHTWTERNGIPGEKKELNVFSNCAEVELFLNGSSLGRLKKDISKFPASGLSWQVSFNEGTNNIEAVGYEGGKKIALDSLKINYSTRKAGKPDDILLSKTRLSDGNYLITATAVDKDKIACTDFDGRIYFTALSGGRLLENRGIPHGSSIIEMANGKASIIFKHIPFERGIVEARNQDFKGSFIEIKE